MGMKKHVLRRLMSGLMMISMISGLSACSNDAVKVSFEAMDTVMSLTVYGGSGSAELIKAKALELDGALSAVDEGSEIYQLDHSGSAELSNDAARLAERSLELCAELGGYFDVTVFPAVYEWGFVTGEYNIPSDERLGELASRIDYKAVELSGGAVALPEGVMLDLGAVAKGYLADKAIEILEEKKADGAVLNLGGTICLYGDKPDKSPFVVGIADPEAPASYFATLSLSAGVVSTSGGYERYFEKDGKRYIHILDPATARPVDNGVLSVTVIAGEGAAADAYSTALFVMGADKAAGLYRERGGFEFVMLTDDGKLYVTEGMRNSLELCEGYEFEVETVGRSGT